MIPSSTFPPHGNRNIWTEDRLLVIHSRGPWNAEFIHEGHALVIKAVEVFADKPWMVLGMIYGDGLQTPDAYAAQIASIQAQHALGRIGTALVLVDKHQSTFFTNFYRNMYAAANEPVEFFPDEASARAWLAEQFGRLDQPDSPPG
jgi:hypothetical protein